ncbi:MAG: ABC transporter permease [Nitrospira sp.]|nr:ABC transporter permease [Nitrospira sp.]MDH4368469.1 ABC transporter permease [Nitrospira sp.]MDH5347801.1 ABC transporter permease [Nitrospira sp.]MDH5496139.1 ABC transporter permease [Nitrospira sp.]MDH5725655.1 ABC transporter permease [Nitrospira sp.]
MNVRRIAAVATKEWKETVRDRLFLLMAFLLPPIWMVVFGYGLVLDVEHVPFAVLDRDQSSLSRDYLYRFIESRYFDYRGSVSDEREIDRLLGDTAIRMAIIVPDRFEEQLVAGRPVTVQTLLDGTFPLYADTTKGYVIAVNNSFTQELLSDFLTRTRGLVPEEARRLVEPVSLQTRYLYNEEVRNTWSMVPALIMFSLMVASPLLTALGVVREKETGSIYNIYSATVSKVEFLVGKLVPYFVISTINVVVLWMIAVWLFGVPFKGSFAVFFSASLLFVLCTTGIGLIISLLVKTQMAALIITIIIAMVPTILFSGLLVPVSSLSPGAQIQAHLFPAMYYTDVVRGSFLKGLDLKDMWTDLLALAGFAVAFRVIAYSLFTKRPKA